MNICHLTTTHPSNDARITRESNTLRRSGHTVTIVTMSSGYPKWQHPFKLIKLAAESLLYDTDIFHCHEPDALVIGLINKYIRGKKVIYDVHEHWPSELPYDIGIPGQLSPIIDRVERWLSCRADTVIAVSESVGKRFNNPIILPNYPDLTTTIIPLPDTINLHTCSTISSNLHTFHGVNDAIAAVQHLSSMGWDDVHLTLIGTVRVTLPTNNAPVTCTGFIPHTEIPEMLQASGVGLVLLQPDYYNIKIGLPNKLFSYMAAGLPVIATNLPEIKPIVEQTMCGILIEPGNIDEIVRAAVWLSEHPEEAFVMGRNGQMAISSTFNWQAVEDRLVGVYRTLTTNFVG